MASGYSYNGWPASDNKQSIDVIPFGDARAFPFPGGVKAGDVWTVLGYVCIQLHERVEECVAGWDWGYSWKANVNNPSQLSCHASATAVDWNAPLHPNGAANTFTDEQVGVIYAILDECQGAVNWLQGYDEMHFEVCVDADTLAGVAASLSLEPAPDDDWLTMATMQDVQDAVVAAMKSPAGKAAIQTAFDERQNTNWGNAGNPAALLNREGGFPDRIAAIVRQVLKET